VKLEELRRSSLIEVEHLKMPETMQRKLTNRDMPAHSAPIPADHNLPSKVKSPLAQASSPTTKDAQYYASVSGSSSPRGLQTVPEESIGSSMDYVKQLQAHDQPQDLSPGSNFYPGGQSATTLNAELSDGHSTSMGRPMFSEPEFGREEVEDDPALRRMRSPGSFSAATAREDNTISPTERWFWFEWLFVMMILRWWVAFEIRFGNVYMRSLLIFFLGLMVRILAFLRIQYSLFHY
jgi:hypothetical protein